MDEAFSRLASDLSLSTVGRPSVTRQAVHSLINEVSLRINVLTFIRRVEMFEHLMREERRHLSVQKKRVENLVEARGLDIEMDLIARFRDQSVSEFVQNWASIVYMISSDSVPHKAMRDMQGVVPLDTTANPIVINQMRKRFNRFRGYKIEAMQTHIAHHFALRFGSDLFRRTKDCSMQKLSPRSEWDEIVLSATAVTLLMLLNDCAYVDLLESSA